MNNTFDLRELERIKKDNFNLLLMYLANNVKDNYLIIDTEVASTVNEIINYYKLAIDIEENLREFKNKHHIKLSKLFSVVEELNKVSKVIINEDVENIPEDIILTLLSYNLVEDIVKDETPDSRDLKDNYEVTYKNVTLDKDIIKCVKYSGLSGYDLPLEIKFLLFYNCRIEYQKLYDSIKDFRLNGVDYTDVTKLELCKKELQVLQNYNNDNIEDYKKFLRGYINSYGN